MRRNVLRDRPELYTKKNGRKSRRRIWHSSINETDMKRVLPILLLVIPFACSNDKEDDGVVYRYEVECSQCSVSYTSGNGSTVTESVTGKLVKEVRFTIEIDVVINIADRKSVV